MMARGLGVGCVLVVTALTLGGCRTSAGSDQAQAEATHLLRVLTQLRAADNAAKRPILEQLKATACTDVAVCEAKSACVKAFEYHVRGVELGQKLRGDLDSPGASPLSADARTALLLEMNVQIEDGKTHMPKCDEALRGLGRLAP